VKQIALVIIIQGSVGKHCARPMFRARTWYQLRMHAANSASKRPLPLDYLLLSVPCTGMGLATRLFCRPGTWIYDDLGDALWAVMVFLVCSNCISAWSLHRRAAVAWFVCILVELSQAVHVPWLDAVRRTRVGALLLGHEFSWHDVVLYTIGIGVALVASIAWQRLMQRRPTFYARAK
jgi:Protein of unknown function (DUF2809)